ncbi:DUF1553 domain-containing protein [Planctomicrobium piriforme]|uniref:Planctomycete cytochrome C n=1 Tax=Planctomicrobium piriforme TaxID=1576369 RepID=A0A1I3RPY5_9PLAN|nr:DUF1553 domain-containing protein [Planctomicrobium piriforme]SFJ47809.1 Planctomycete cytochrome C [Planctomicrobium piriforme]
MNHSVSSRWISQQPWLRTLSLLCLAGCSAVAAADDPPLQYNRDIRPILAEACFSCHGPDSASRKAGLRLDDRDAAIEMSAIAPGDPGLSELISRIDATDPHEIMPPPETKKTLTAEQKETLKKWIQQGAEYQLHWSFLQPSKPAIPEVADKAWSQNPIDKFILSKLERQSLTPAPAADRRTLARRLSFDLTGLPPEPEMVERFVNDASPQAYEKLVDHLMSSPAWGEHRGRYWLDYSRYADTHGIHFDNFREMWSYRDWVIDAFNRNMPFDQFTIENLAGDLLPNATLEQKIASGFNRCNMTTNEGGIIDEEYLVLYTRDRTETTAQVWLGLTAGCAVCHSHKFDPISQAEFYQLAAFFNNTTQAAKDGNIKDTPPILVVPRDEELVRWDAVSAEVKASQAQVQARRDAARPEFDAWLPTARPEVFVSNLSTERLELHAALNQKGPTTQVTVGDAFVTQPLHESTEWQAGPVGGDAAQISKAALAEFPDAGDFAENEGFTYSAWVKTPANDGSGAIAARMDNEHGHRGWDFWIEGRRIATHIIHDWPENALKVAAKTQLPANKWVHVAVTYDGSSKASGVQIYYDGVAQATNVIADKLKGSIQTTVPLKIGQRHTVSPATGVALQDLRLYRRQLAADEVASLGQATRLAGLLNKPADKRDAKEVDQIYSWWLANLDGPYRQESEILAVQEREQSEIKSRGTIAHVMQEKPEEAMAFILNRGEYDQRLDKVTPNTPAVLPPFPADAPRNRLTLAKWLLQPDQPLTARVTVNRFWQEVFGAGLVKTSGDFGVMGDLPSHPELLDWLALDFVESGWDIKHLFKMMVMSSTYQQAAITTPEKRECDPENRLLARGPRFRMDAEMVRDSALAASGTLIPELGGPSVKPYQPEGLWEVVGMPGSTTRNYVRDSGTKLYRRSLYTFIKRMSPPASLEIFNAPNRELCVVRRERTNTALQALVTLNDEQFVEAARNLAQRAILTAGTEPRARLNFISQRIISREFQPAELAVIAKSLEQLQKYYHETPDDAGKLIHFGESAPDESIPAVELAAWTMLTNELMNLDEVLNK